MLAAKAGVSRFAVLEVISIVWVYNNKATLEGCLLKSLQLQTLDYQLSLVDNTEGRFGSASKALNFGAANANGKYLMFVHQDVDLCSTSQLLNTEKLLDSISGLGIAGVAGRKDKGGLLITAIRHGDPPVRASRTHIENPTLVQTLDECLVIVPRPVFHKLQFAEETCDDWHLYGVDYCLSSTALALGVYTIPMYAYHRSTGSRDGNPFRIILNTGSLPEGYYCTLRKLLVKHRHRYRVIHTTTGDWDTRLPLTFQRICLLPRELLLAGIEPGLKMVRRWTQESYIQKSP